MLERIKGRIRQIQLLFVTGAGLLSLLLVLFELYEFKLGFGGEEGIIGYFTLFIDHPELFILIIVPFVITFGIYYLINKMKAIAFEPFAQLREQEVHLEMMSNFATELGKGNYEADYTLTGESDVLGKILLDMRDNTKQNIIEEKRRNWSVSGVALFADILRNSQDSIEMLSGQLIQQLVKYVGCNQGGVFLIDDTDPNNVRIKASALYAYEREKHDVIDLEIGEGLIGQCIYEKEYIHLTDIPSEYVNITSGLGEATPKSILIVPILMNEEVHGAVEIATFNTFEEHEIEFIQGVANSFASTVSNVKMNENTKALLAESQDLTEEMKGKEEEMRQNAEELQATQDELSVKLKEIEEETTKTQNIVDAIDKTNAAIEYDMNGNITHVNSMFLSVTGYSEAELIGKHESFFVPEEEKSSPRYTIMWGSLSEGQVFSGEFKRLAKDGKTLWLTGTYNPIFNLQGTPVKIIKYAQFVTDEKEKTLDLHSKINALGQVLAVVDLKPDGSIISGNSTFIAAFGFKRLQLKKMTFDDLCATLEGDNKIDFTKVSHEGVLTRELLLKDSEGIFKYYQCHISPIQNLAGEISKLLVILIDINEQKKIETELKEEIKEVRANSMIQEADASESDELMSILEKIIGTISDADGVEKLGQFDEALLLVTDNDGAIVNANDKLITRGGYSKEDLIGKSIMEELSFSNNEKVENAIKGGKVFQKPTKVTLKNEEAMDVEILISPAFTDAGLRILVILKGA